MKSSRCAWMAGALIVLSLGFAGCEFRHAQTEAVADAPGQARSERSPSQEAQLPANSNSATGSAAAGESASTARKEAGSPSPDSPPRSTQRRDTDTPLPDVVAGDDASAMDDRAVRQTGGVDDSDPQDASLAGGVQDAAASADVRPLADWSEPLLALVLTGRQHGYIEPCGCTGLDRQKGGLARRHTFLKQLRRERGWAVVPLDAGDFTQRFGRQAEIKFQITAQALQTMGYEAATFGLDDLRLSIDELAATTAFVEGQPSLFISANVAVLDREFTPRYKIIEAAGKRIAVTAVLGDGARKQLQADELLHEPAAAALEAVWKELKAEQCDYHVLLAQATLDETLALARRVPHFQLVVTSGGGEEPSFEPERIAETPSILVKVGAKGMYAGVIGLFDDPQRPWRYERVALDKRFADAREMRDLMATYQGQLERLGLEGLGLRPVAHPAGRSFVGSQACQECHASEYEVWENSRHAHALDSLLEPNERSDVPRHFDPECLSCHVTGWNPQRFFPYASGYLGRSETPHLAGSGCENCHGPGEAHVAAERGTRNVSASAARKLREQMRLTLADAEKRCMECHDLDNSPDFHERGAFQHYWEQIAH